MRLSTIPLTATMCALGAAMLVSGCCGPKHNKTTAYYDSSGTTTHYSSSSAAMAGTGTTRTYASDQSSSTTNQWTAPSDRTNVRESMAGNANDWSLPLYSESLRVGKREVENGSVKLRKVVHTENANQPVDLRRETVVIDRESFDQARQAADAGQPNNFGMAFQEKEITIDLKREEPVVEVQPYVSGRIVAQKRVQTDQQNIARQVRHEEVEVIKQGNERDITVSERLQNRNEAIGAPGRMQNRQTGSGSTNQNFNQDLDLTNPDDVGEPTEIPTD